MSFFLNDCSFTVPKKEATEFTREIGLKVDNPSLKLAVEKALLFLDKDELPPHWDRDLLFGLVDTDVEDDSDQLDSDVSLAQGPWVFPNKTKKCKKNSF